MPAPKVVLANGCFDILHVAHLRHLEEARRMGDLLVVGLTMDAHVGKEGRPIIQQNERMELLRGLRCVSAVMLCRNSLEALKVWQPAVFVKGADYIEKGLLPEEIAYCKENGIQIRHTKPNPQTTSKLIDRIRSIAS